MAAEPIVEPFEQWIPRIIPGSEPQPGPDVEYPGQGAVRLWDDVYNYGKSVLHYFSRSHGGTAYVMADQLNEAIDSAVGATIKALSGPINRAAEIGADAQEWASMELDAMSANIGSIYQYFDDRVSGLERIQDALVHNYVPLVAGEVAQLRSDMMAGFAFNSAADRQWATDNIFKPLQENIGATIRAIPEAAADAEARANQYTDDAVQRLGVNVLSGIAPVVAAVSALQAESEDCTQPMCDTIGPKTDLGKLLKGLKLGAEIAALTAILDMNADDLANLIHAVTSHLASLVGDVEQFLAPGGETVAGLIAHATAEAL